MKKVKGLAPKTRNWRRFLKISIWVLIVFWTLGSLRGFSVAAKLNSQPEIQQSEQTELKEENFATSIGAQTFAENFLEEYLSWDKDDYQERAERLAPYLREGVDEQAGLRFDTVTSNSSHKKTELWEVSETGENTSLITFKTTQMVTTVPEDKKVKPKKSGPFEKWIQVPIITDGKSFLVNGVPTLTSKPAEVKIKPLEEPVAEPEVNSKTAAEIEKFLATFLKQYATGTIEELEFLTSVKSIQPLGEGVEFQEIEKLIVLEKKKESYVVEASGVFLDQHSKTQVLQIYNLEVSEKDGRWQVIKFN